jgi:hypothetical protein
LGGILDTYSRSVVFISLAQFAMNSGTFYVIVVKNLNIPLWVFATLLPVSVLTVMLLTWMFVTPSAMSYINQQQARHDSPVIRKLNLLLKDKGITDYGDDLPTNIKVMK